MINEQRAWRKSQALPSCGPNQNKKDHFWFLFSISLNTEFYSFGGSFLWLFNAIYLLNYNTVTCIYFIFYSKLWIILSPGTQNSLLSDLYLILFTLFYLQSIYTSNQRNCYKIKFVVGDKILFIKVIAYYLKLINKLFIL